MSEALPISQVLIAVCLSGLIILATRILPFLIFSKGKVPLLVRFIEKYAPALIMAILFIYCLKDIDLSSVSHGIEYFIAIAAVVGLHLAFKNAMVSIFGGTAFFILLSRLLPLIFA